MTNATVGRRPDGPGAYLYEDEDNLFDCLVHYNHAGTALAALWVDGNLGFPTDAWGFVDNMPGEFTPLSKPAVMPEPDWSQAPDGAQWWAVEYAAGEKGLAYWFAGQPCLDSGEWINPYNGLDKKFGGVVSLPFGVDWRLTLRRRPEADDE